MDKTKYYRFSGLALSFVLLLGGCASAPDMPETVSAPLEDVEEVEEQSEAEPVIEFREDHPQRYTVVVGDTLWGISSHFLKDPWRWPEVWQSNPQVSDPHLIYPGDILIFRSVDGVAYIEVERPPSAIPVIRQESPRPAPGASPPPPPPPPPQQVARVITKGGAYPTERLSPRLRVKNIEEAIATIPTKAISSFLIKPLVVSKRELDNAPYVLSSMDNHLIAGVENTLYIRNLTKSPNLRYTIVRKGSPFIDPKNGNVLGYEAIYLAEGVITRKGDPASLKVKYAKREILNGDRLLETEPQQPDRDFNPRAPEQNVDAQIISVVDGVTMIGQYQIVVLDLGRQDEIEPGHILAVYRSGTKVRDSRTSDMVKLPDERSGVLMVFRVFDEVSYALVMEATVPLHLLDRVTNP